MVNDELVKLRYANRLPIHDFEKPYQIISELSGVYRKSNIECNLAPERERIQDLRGQERLYGIDSHGFQVLEHYSAIKDWSDKQAVEEHYLPEVERLIANHLDGVDEVYIFNWRVRLSQVRQRIYN